VKILAFRYTDDIPQMQAFLTALGLRGDLASAAGSYVQLDADAGAAALHTAAGADGPRRTGDTDISFESDELLEDVRDRLVAAGFGDAVVLDESFGRSLRVTDPDGVPVQVNASMTDLHGYTRAGAATA